MTRPDPRLLVPVGALPLVPDGCDDFLCASCGCVSKWGDDECYHCDHGGGRGSRVLDLSAPTLRGGLPERLDALPWALKVLGWKSITVFPDGTYDNGSAWFPLPLVAATGLSPDDASRAVVVAALVAKGRP